jgi:DNA-binding HxlR family transcriptional regulator
MNSIQQQAAMMSALKIINEKWSIAVIHQITLGHQCFNQIAECLPNLSPTLISNRLKSLVRQKLVEKTEKQMGHGFFYQLTQLGQQFAPVINFLCDWGVSAKQQDLSDAEKHIDGLLQQHFNRIDADNLSCQSYVLKIHIKDMPKYRDWWVVIGQKDITLVMDEPVARVNCHLTTYVSTMISLLNGELSSQAAKLQGALILNGDVAACHTFHDLFKDIKNHRKSFNVSKQLVRFSLPPNHSILPNNNELGYTTAHSFN